MSGRLDILGDVVAALESQRALNESMGRWAKLQDKQIDRLWADNAELRDEVVALANRVESLTRAFRQTVTNPGGDA